MSLKDQTVLITGASMGIGAAIARRLAAENATLILFARSGDKLKAFSDELKAEHKDLKIFLSVVDVQDHTSLSTAIANIVQKVSHIDILINNAGLAIGAPSRFPDLEIQDIITMTSTNINGYMFAAYAVLNEGKMKERGKGTILNVTSTTGLEVPPFPGEAVYHASKACQEAFTNVLRTELVGTDIKVLALRPGVVATNFHEQRYGLARFSFVHVFSYIPSRTSRTCRTFRFYSFLRLILHRNLRLITYLVLDMTSKATTLSCPASSLLLLLTLRRRLLLC
jgi:NADP-dependent 3-hydroxy acid dehydrogenase YdfG